MISCVLTVSHQSLFYFFAEAETTCPEAKACETAHCFAQLHIACPGESEEAGNRLITWRLDNKVTIQHAAFLCVCVVDHVPLVQRKELSRWGGRCCTWPGYFTGLVSVCVFRDTGSYSLLHSSLLQAFRHTHLQTLSADWAHFRSCFGEVRRYLGPSVSNCS